MLQIGIQSGKAWTGLGLEEGLERKQCTEKENTGRDPWFSFDPFSAKRACTKVGARKGEYRDRPYLRASVLRVGLSFSTRNDTGGKPAERAGFRLATRRAARSAARRLTPGSCSPIQVLSTVAGGASLR